VCKLKFVHIELRNILYSQYRDAVIYSQQRCHTVKTVPYYTDTMFILYRKPLNL